MDMQALKNDAKLALQTLPKELVDVLMFLAHKVLAEHRQKLEETFPLVMEYLKPHANAIMFEMACGTLDKTALEATLTEALAEVTASRVPMGAPNVTHGR
jgi:hypothetical protein